MATSKIEKSNITNFESRKSNTTKLTIGTNSKNSQASKPMIANAKDKQNTIPPFMLMLQKHKNNKTSMNNNKTVNEPKLNVNKVDELKNDNHKTILTPPKTQKYSDSDNDDDKSDSPKNQSDLQIMNKMLTTNNGPSKQSNKYIYDDTDDDTDDNKMNHNSTGSNDDDSSNLKLPKNQLFDVDVNNLVKLNTKKPLKMENYFEKDLDDAAGKYHSAKLEPYEISQKKLKNAYLNKHILPNIIANIIVKYYVDHRFISNKNENFIKYYSLFKEEFHNNLKVYLSNYTGRLSNNHINYNPKEYAKYTKEISKYIFTKNKGIYYMKIKANNYSQTHKKYVYNLISCFDNMEITKYLENSIPKPNKSSKKLLYVHVCFVLESCKNFDTQKDRRIIQINCAHNMTDLVNNDSLVSVDEYYKFQSDEIYGISSQNNYYFDIT